MGRLVIDNFDDDLKRKFAAWCTMSGTTMKDKVSAMIETFVAENPLVFSEEKTNTPKEKGRK
jgi:hypothetical protein